MRIRFIREWSGRQSVEVDDVEASVARRLIKHGYAVLYEVEKSAVEAAATVTQHIDFLDLGVEDEPAQPTDSPDTGDTEKEES